MSAKIAGATDVAEETALPEEEEIGQEQEQEESPAVPQPSELLKGVLEELGKPDEEEKLSSPPKTPVEGEDAKPEEEEEEGKEEEPEELKPAAEKSKEEEKPVPKQWPQSAKQRVAEESQKRRERTEERDKAIGERDQWKAAASDLYQKLQTAQAPQPTPDNPLADVNDPASFTRARDHFLFWLKFANENPDGAEGVVVGKNQDGSDKTANFTKEIIADMKTKAERGLMVDLPSRTKFLEARGVSDGQAVEAYPELVQPESPFAQEVSEFIRKVPELLNYSDAVFWVAHAIAGRNAYLAKRNGQSKSTKTGVQEVSSASKIRVAPGIVKKRSIPAREKSSGQSADIDSAKRKMQTTGDMEEFIAAKLGASRSLNREPVEA